MLELKSIVPNLVKVANDPIKIKAFKAANEAMAELFTAGIIGNQCVRKQLITTPMVQSLSKTCFSILLPMFLLTSIMKTVQANGGRLTANTIKIPIIVVVHSLLLNFVSRYCLLPLFNMYEHSDEGRSTVLCCTFGNSGVIPLIFAEVLFRHNAEVLQKAYSFVSLYLVGWSPFFWSFGRFSLLGGDSSAKNSKRSSSLERGNNENMMSMTLKLIASMKSLFPPPVVGVVTGLIVASIPFLRELFMGGSSATLNGEINKPMLGMIYNCFQNLGRAANPLALLVLTSSLALDNSNSRSTRAYSSAVKEDGMNTKAFITSSSSFGRNGISGSSSFGSTMKEQLGTNTTAFITSSSSSSSLQGRGGNSHGGASLIQRLSCVSIARFIISPLLMMIMLQKTIGPLNNNCSTTAIVSDNAMMWFILMLQSCMPPAQGAVLMLQVAEKTHEASTLAKFLFSMYTIAMLPIVLISTILLEKCQLTQV